MEMAVDDDNERLRAVFDVCDTEQCGYISVDHFVRLATEHFCASDWDSTILEERLSQIIDVLDPDGAGQIFFNQFCEGVRRIMELQGLSTPAVSSSESYRPFQLTAADAPTNNASTTSVSTVTAAGDDDDVTDRLRPVVDVDADVDRCNNDEVVDDVTYFRRQASSLEDDVDSGFGSRYPDHIEHSGHNGPWLGCVDDQNLEYQSEDNSPECSTADMPPSPAVNNNSFCSPSVSGRHVTPSSVARQLYRAQLNNTSRRSSLSDTVYDDIDGSFIELNDKVKVLEEKVRDLTESQQRSNERQTKMKEENGQLVRRVHVLEEQLRDVESRAREQLAEEQRKHRELLTRSDKDKTREIEILAQNLQRVESEYLVLRDEAPALRSENDRLKRENGRQSRELDELQLKFADLTEEHKMLQDHAHSEQLKMTKERSIHSQLLDELTRELDELRYFKAELLAKSPTSQRSDLSKSHRRQLEEHIAQLKLENLSLREQTEELHAQLLHRHVAEGRALLQHNSKSLAAEIDSLSLDELKEVLSKEREANEKLRDYIERITLRILEKNPSILEVSQ